MIEVVVGQPIPLSLQVFDGRADVEVTAIIFDQYGKRLLDQKLVHINQGLYSSFDVEMFDINLLVAQYVTNKPEDYHIAYDTFKAIPKPIPQEKFMVGEVVSKDQWDDTDMIMGEAYVDQENENP